MEFKNFHLHEHLRSANAQIHSSLKKKEKKKTTETVF